VLREERSGSNMFHRAGELFSQSRNQLRIMKGLLTGHFLHWYLFQNVIDANRYLKQPDMFFVTGRLW
jgi:hypothetical protein